MYWTWRVWARKAGMPEARNCSPSPRPTISGHSLRAPTMTPGSSAATATKRVVAAQAVVGEPDGLGQVAGLVELARDQVRHDLDVGLGRELGALGEELLLELHVVLDDPVDHDVDAVVGVEVRVGVLLGDAAVRGPAGVADAGRGGRGRDRDGAAESPSLGPSSTAARSALRLPTARTDSSSTVALDRDSRGVIAAVLQLLKTLEQDLLHRALSDVADDAAHGPGLLSRVRRPTLDGRPF